VFVAGVINDAFNQASSLTTTSNSRVSDALSNIGSSPVVPKTTLPTVNVPQLTPLSAQDKDISGVEAKVQSLTTYYRQLLTTDLTTFLNTYFPLGSELAAARDWLSAAIAGGTGVNPNIEAQLWGRDRDRVLADQARAEEDVATTWAAKRFPLPPGAATYQVAMLQRAGMAQIAEASRNAAVKMYEVGVENMRFAVGKAIDLRTAALQAAAEYIKTLALAPQLATDLEKALVEAKTKMASMVAEYYRAQLAAIDATLRVPLAKAELDLKVDNLNIDTQVNLLKMRVDATMSAAQMLATQAAAVLNSMHATAGFSGQESV
jgi:hypothetical protein